MPTHTDLKQSARQQAREVLAMSAGFARLPESEQFATYQRLVDDNYRQLARQQGLLSTAQVDFPIGAPRASDSIDDTRHQNKRVEQAGQLAGDFIEQVDFPKFVRDLLKGVFDANLQVTLAQMDKFIELMKAATASISKFINAIDDSESFAYLADNDSDNFSLGFDDEDQSGDGGQRKQVLLDRDGNKADLSDNAVKAKIMDAKIAMAREQRALLRETILMGVSRLVVERGRVQASVIFDFKTTEVVQKADKAAVQRQFAHSSSMRANSGVLGMIFGGGQGDSTTTARQTQISVASAKSEANTTLAAKVAGSVDITFKSDYFKLDNFAAMYGGLGGAAGGPAQAGGGAAAPAPAAPAAPMLPGAAPGAPALPAAGVAPR